jgi:hypothetical protein
MINIIHYIKFINFLIFYTNEKVTIYKTIKKNYTLIKILLNKILIK